MLLTAKQRYNLNAFRKQYNKPVIYDDAFQCFKQFHLCRHHYMYIHVHVGCTYTVIFTRLLTDCNFWAVQVHVYVHSLVHVHMCMFVFIYTYMYDMYVQTHVHVYE